MKKLTKPKTKPTKSKICQLSVNSIPKKELSPGITFKETPGTNLAAKKIPNIPAIICKIKRFMTLLIFFNNTNFLDEGQSLLIFDDKKWQNDELRPLAAKSN